ncbi:AGE family epimerase/isomerase [Hahella sp. CCB-MM4]|uniref:AGE family epimerase/isomerase n=1 Tax=Hahella sp. (strain CCB-MM4) TaxID=1926491 RepID=UPI000B9C6AA2|nr:AGE family epimerase/isomerase [Hahella sp. CCB-MM4]
MYRNETFLVKHCREILEFYRDRCIDPAGGYFQNFFDNGEVFDHGTKHLVSSTRMMFNFYRGYFEFREQWMLEHAQHGFEFLKTRHQRQDSRGFVWTLEDNEPADLTQYCYGYAFVMLSLSAAVKAREPGAAEWLDEVWELWESEFWLSEQGLYADEISADWSEVSGYRGQNANMHACEALLFCYEATGQNRYLDRARQLAEIFTGQLVSDTQGLIWEHYHQDLSIDWDFNRDDPKNLYKPWGFQPGHQTEWSKLLLMLHRHDENPEWLQRARFLFDKSMEVAWDHDFQGLYYGFAPDGSICDDDKYFWVQAESLAAAAMLAQTSGDDNYWQSCEKLWEYCWNHFVDHTHGAWFRLLTRNNHCVSNRKSEAGSKCDYHNLNALFEVIQVLRA